MRKIFFKLRNEWIPIMIGSALYAFGIHFFLVPNELMEGGLTGISILLHYALGFPLSVTTLVLNIPLFIAGWRMLGKRGMYLTIFGTVMLSVFLYIIERFIAKGWILPFVTEDDLLLTALYAGFVMGLGLGIVLRFGGTTGGIDIVARAVNRRKGWSMGRFFLVFDSAVISLSLLYITMESVLYTLVAVFISARMVDVIQQGEYAARAFTIITSHPQKIGEQIMRELERGVTFIPARGGFSGETKELLYCVVYRQETRRLEQLVRRIDRRAFIIVSEVHNVLGEGFRGEQEPEQ